MENFLLIFKILCFTLSVSYFLLIFFYIINWERVPVFFSSSVSNKVFVSIIVAARNEEKNIEKCLNHLAKQNFPDDFFEIIIVNDFSEDKTQQIVESFIASGKKTKIRLINLDEILKEKNGSKKTAITEGVKQAYGELIITTDSDCTMNTNWLKTIANYYQQHNTYLLSAPVTFVEKKLFEKIQSLEFMSLIGIGSATIKARYPLMCNAANLAFKKEIYFEVGRMDTSEEPFSGDDTFLMFAIHKKYPDKIAFIKSHDAIVFTNAQSSIKEFFNQRKRWTSKIKSYSQYYVQLTGALVFLFHISILCNAVASIFYKTFLPALIFQIAIKFIMDFIFMYQVGGFFKKRNLLWLFLPVEIMHLFYIVIISLFSARATYHWKKRKISN